MKIEYEKFFCPECKQAQLMDDGTCLFCPNCGQHFPLVRIQEIFLATKD